MVLPEVVMLHAYWQGTPPLRDLVEGIAQALGVKYRAPSQATAEQVAELAAMPEFEE